MVKKDIVIDDIIKNLGGKDNIINAWHCMTRLRFDIKNEELIDKNSIDNLSGVLGSQNQNGQFQIIIGTEVESYFNILSKKLNLSTENNDVSDDDKKSIGKLFMDILSGVFGPIVPAIAGAGMIKGLIAGLVALEVISEKSDTIKVLDMLASGVFTFLPFFIAASAAKNIQNKYIFSDSYCSIYDVSYYDRSSRCR